MRRPGLRATTSVEQLPQRAPGPSRAPCALHGEGPGHVSSCGNFRGTATSACAGAEACARGCMPPAPRGHGAHQQAEHARGAKAWAADARRRPRPPQGAGQFRGRATCACAGAEPCAVPLHGEGPGKRAREIRRTATAEGWDEACAQRDASQVLGPCSLVGGITRTSGRPDARSSPPGRRRPGSTGRSYRAARARAAP
jgi:hypothetical protein